MRKYSNEVVDIINASEINLNSISKLSGLSNAYLTKLSKGNINLPGKGKIASILLALNYSISSINAVLAKYDYRPLNHLDIPELLANNRRRKIEGRMMPHYDRLYAELVLAATEHIGGNKVVVTNGPSGVYQPHRLYLQKEYQHEEDGDAGVFLLEFASSVVRDRLDAFRAGCKSGYKNIGYICCECFSESLERNLKRVVQEANEERLTLLAQYYANAMSCAIKFPHQHQFHIVERCSQFQFLMQDVDSESPKVIFSGQSPHAFANPFDQLNLEGFSTDAPSFVNLFQMEIAMCEQSVNKKDPRNTPDGLSEYIYSKFVKWDVGAYYESALQHLLSTADFTLY